MRAVQKPQLESKTIYARLYLHITRPCDWIRVGIPTINNSFLGNIRQRSNYKGKGVTLLPAAADCRECSGYDTAK